MEKAVGPKFKQQKAKKKLVTLADAIKEFNSSRNPLRYYTFTDFNRQINKSLRKDRLPTKP